ncbi:hypothetical protein [Roseobacter litoralis]|uniref:hypothetical protein n=1 Tax=Roseobacter litoralis TaxID=42443 RepID=UPI0024912C08|nr:hypothetical protein [Roseobacter litoralis]
MSYTTQQPKAAAPTPQLARAQKRGEAQTGPDRALAGMHEAAEISPVVARLQAFQRMADQSSDAGPSGAPIQRKVVINGLQYANRTELARSTDEGALTTFLAVKDDTKDEKLKSDKIYEINDGALVESQGEVEAEAPELIESAQERELREQNAADLQRANDKATWNGRIAHLKVGIAAGSYITHGRSFAHLAVSAGGDGLTKFTSVAEVKAYLKTRVDDFTCTAATDWNEQPAGDFRITIEPKHMNDGGKSGSVILVLTSNRRVVLHHFGNI